MVLVCQFWDGIPMLKGKMAPPTIHHKLVSKMPCSSVLNFTIHEQAALGCTDSPVHDHTRTPPHHTEVILMTPMHPCKMRCGEHAIQVE